MEGLSSLRACLRAQGTCPPKAQATLWTTPASRPASWFQAPDLTENTLACRSVAA